MEATDLKRGDKIVYQVPGDDACTATVVRILEGRQSIVFKDDAGFTWTEPYAQIPVISKGGRIK